MSTVSRRESTVSTTTQVSPQQPPVYPQQMLEDAQNTGNLHPPFSYSLPPASSGIHEPIQVDAMRGATAQTTGAPTYSNGTYGPSQPLVQPAQPAQSTQSDDMRYWNNMFRDLGFGEAVDQTYGGQNPANASSPHQPAPPHPYTHHGYNGRGTGHNQPYAYHHMHTNAPGYGL
jgi:hypothetical protein